MKSISKIITNIKKLLPYLLLISIYFFFINLEAGKDKKPNATSKNEYIVTDEESSEQYKPQRIEIPVIPYRK